MTPEALDLADEHDGIWGEHPEHSLSDWRYEVENNDTRLGYWDWVLSAIEQAEVDLAMDEEAPQ